MAEKKSYQSQLNRCYDNGASAMFSSELNSYSDGSSKWIFSLNSMEDASVLWQGSLAELTDKLLKKESE